MTIQKILFGWEGRIRRRTFWLWSIINGLISALIYLGNFALWHSGARPGSAGGVPDPVGYVIIDLGTLLISFYVSFCLIAKRLHDRNRRTSIAIGVAVINLLYTVQTSYFPTQTNASAGVGLKVFIFIAGIVFLIECGLLDGTPGRNKYGPSPKDIFNESEVF